LTYQSFIAIAGDPPEPVLEEYSELPPVGDTGEYELLPVPTVEELGYGDISQVQVESRLIQRSSISVAAGSSLNFLMANCRRRFLHSEEGRQKLLGE
jgi:hypothetical protein